MLLILRSPVMPGFLIIDEKILIPFRYMPHSVNYFADYRGEINFIELTFFFCQ